MRQSLRVKLGRWLWLFGLLSGCEPAADLAKPDSDKGIQTAAYGSWVSAVSAADVYAPADNIIELQAIDDGLYFIQTDASQQGKKSVNKLNKDGSVTPVIGADFDVGSRVNEYGGAPVLGIGQSLFASKRSDQRLYRIAPNQAPLALTALKTRHADCIFQTRGARLICVQEDHRQAGEPVTRLVGINISYAADTQILVEGSDFYSSPVLSPDQTQMAWLAWQDPNMPWDHTELWLADIDQTGTLMTPYRVLIERKGAITQPVFGPDGQLYFVADFNNWWNLYRLNDKQEAELIYQREAEFAVPDWKMGNHNYAFEDQDHLVASFSQQGSAGLVRINLKTGQAEPIEVDFAEVSQVLKGHDGIYFIGKKSTPEQGIYKINADKIELVYAPAVAPIDPNYISHAQSMHFVSGNRTEVHGYFYAPTNPEYRGPKDARPPLLVMLHQGPTDKASSAFRRDIQYWTSRGIAVFDLNYRGSSGFGRQYRESLYGHWGKFDAEDAVRAAGFLVNKGLVDGTKLAIKGFREEGLSTLAALASYNTFKAGVIYSGISNAELFQDEMHKFESRYLKRLLGEGVQSQGSAATFYLKGLSEPLLFIQGVDELMISAEQSRFIYDTLKSKGVPTAYLAFKRLQPDMVNMHSPEAVLHSELSFYGQVFGFTPAGGIPKLHLDNAHNLPPLKFKD